MDIHFKDKQGRECVAWFGDDDYMPSSKALAEVQETFPDAFIGKGMHDPDIDLGSLFFVAKWNCYALRHPISKSEATKDETA